MQSPSNGMVEDAIPKLVRVYKKIETREKWSKWVLFVCVAALAIDPLFFFIAVVDSHRLCLTFDKKLVAAVCVLRTLIDTLYAIHITFYFIMEVVAPRTYPSLRGELIVHSNANRNRWFPFRFTVDIVSILPVPQVVVLTLITRRRQSSSLVSREILKWIILAQYIPRIVRIYPLYKQVTENSGTVATTRWIGAAFNLFLYMLQSHVFGAFWYIGAVEKKDRCWREACTKTPGCNLNNLFCARGGRDNNIRFLTNSCPLINPDDITSSTIFNFGMYINALKSGIVESRDFPSKFFQCFWWGLRNLSALGSNLETSNSVGEIFFAIIICISGVLMFAVLIGNVQKYLQPLTIRVDEMEEKKRDTEKWMLSRGLPEHLKRRIRRHENYKWRETRGAEEETLLGNLPKELRMETKCHLYMKFLKVYPFSVMDASVLKELCARFKAVLYTKGTKIVCKGNLMDEMLFIIKGEVFTIEDEPRDAILSAGDFFGDIISPAVTHPHTSHVPISSATLYAMTEVEGAVLSTNDLKSVISQYPQFFQNREVQFAFWSRTVEWRTRGARVIQAAYRSHCKRKLAKALGEKEGNQNSDDPGGNKLSLGASRFASLALRFMGKRSSSSSSSTRL